MAGRATRYSLTYEANGRLQGVNCGSVKIGKRYIKDIREREKEKNPCNFKIYDSFTDDEYAPVVYEEE